MGVLSNFTRAHLLKRRMIKARSRWQRPLVQWLAWFVPNRSFKYALVSMGLVVLGCQSPMTGEHEVLLRLPANPCIQGTGCRKYKTCNDLQIRLIDITVGPAWPQRNIVLCPSVPTSNLYSYPLDYVPGYGPYELEASFMRDGSKVIIHAGPYPEVDPNQPWTIDLY